MQHKQLQGLCTKIVCDTVKLKGLMLPCKLPQRVLGLNPSRNRIWCILALKSDIWWQQF